MTITVKDPGNKPFDSIERFALIQCVVLKSSKMNIILAEENLESYYVFKTVINSGEMNYPSIFKCKINGLIGNEYFLFF